ncbi:MAG: hypothetical protein JNK50_14485 [Bacteroidia bacterium]|nr:hypothetical protein [Bacteroidia bacterium]MBN8694340.1 hypothetical protein [Bacteroidota bacterium]
MKEYSPFVINQFTKHVLNDTAASNWLIENNYKELIATLDAVRDDKHAFKYLIDGKFFELAAFVNTIWEDSKAFKFLIDNKYFDWAACANIINGDEKAEQALLKYNKKHFVQLAHAIQGRIREDGDRNVSPWGVMQNMLNFKKAFEKDPEDKKKK